MGKITIIDFKGRKISASGLKYVAPPTLEASFGIEVDKKIEKEVSLDKILRREFEGEAKAIMKMTIEMIEKKLKIFDNLFQTMFDKGAAAGFVMTQMEGLNKALAEDIRVAKIAAVMAFEKAWANICAARKEWRNFKIKIFATIAASLASFAISLAALVTTPFTGGASAALSIVGCVKSGVTICANLAKLGTSFVEAHDALETELSTLEKRAESKGLMAANEITAAILTEFLGVAQSNIKSCQDIFATMRAKYAKLVVDVHDLAKTISKIELERARLEKEFMAEVEKKLKAHPTSKKMEQKKRIAENLRLAMVDMDNMVAEKSKNMEGMYKYTKDMSPHLAKVDKRMTQLNLKDLKGVKLFREALKLGTVALSPLDGNSLRRRRMICSSTSAFQPRDMPMTRSPPKRWMDRVSTCEALIQRLTAARPLVARRKVERLPRRLGPSLDGRQIGRHLGRASCAGDTKGRTVDAVTDEVWFQGKGHQNGKDQSHIA